MLAGCDDLSPKEIRESWVLLFPTEGQLALFPNLPRGKRPPFTLDAPTSSQALLGLGKENLPWNTQSLRFERRHEELISLQIM